MNEFKPKYGKVVHAYTSGNGKKWYRVVWKKSGKPAPGEFNTYCDTRKQALVLALDFDRFVEEVLANVKED